MLLYNNSLQGENLNILWSGINLILFHNNNFINIIYNTGLGKLAFANVRGFPGRSWNYRNSRLLDCPDVS